MGRWAQVFGCLLEIIYPERCLLCGAEPHEARWVERGSSVAGMRAWDGPHLCQFCGDSLGSGFVTGRVGHGQGADLAVIAAVATNPGLVKLVGQFKYHGVRGLAWPLARMLSTPLGTAVRAWGPVDALVPVALHRRRRRMRGFNQAEILARLAAAGRNVPVRTDVQFRHRNTEQQAKISTPEKRRGNLAAAFWSRPPVGPAKASGTPVKRIVLVDDLVTSGCTALAAAQSLQSAGWEVVGVLALGLAANVKIRGPRVDTWEGGF
jgi:predicted amidophosphoribosyltransferase